MRRVRATQDEEEGDPDYEDQNEDEPIEPVRRCTYPQCKKGCFNEESLRRHVSIAIRVLCTALLFKTADALRSSEHTTLRGYATQLSVLRVPARRVLCTTALVCKTFDALRFQSVYPEGVRDATLCFACACDTVNFSLPHAQGGKGRQLQRGGGGRAAVGRASGGVARKKSRGGAYEVFSWFYYQNDCIPSKNLYILHFWDILFILRTLKRRENEMKA